MLAQFNALPPDKPPAGALAGLVVGTVKSTMDLAEAMKDDLSQFILGSMGEKQLRVLIVRQARTQERSVLLGLWRSDAIQKSWLAWLQDTRSQSDAEGSAHDKYMLRLVQALGSTSPVSCNLPTKLISVDGKINSEVLVTRPPNSLPPPFFFVTPSLLYIQNYLQALVIAASLRSLTRLAPPSASQSSADGVGSDFMRRIWVLLTAEITEDKGHRSDDDSTKLVNLADEVIRARTFAIRLESSSTTIDAAEENRLRSAVERTLQPSDPVFLLLQKRLMGAISNRLIQLGKSGSEAAIVPERMQTGRDRQAERVGKRPRLILDLDDMRQGDREHTAEKEKGLVVKGFEDPVLVSAVGEALGKITGYVEWVEETWGDLVESGGGSTEG